MSSKRILFIDDTQDTLVILMRVARLVGGVPRVARDLETALKIIRQEPPEVILVDYRMPQMDGITLIRHLRQANPNCRARIYLLTAEDPSSLRAQALQAGAEDVLAKPLSLEALMEVLHV